VRVAILVVKEPLILIFSPRHGGEETAFYYKHTGLFA
jgi:hypothetical protein